VTFGKEISLLRPPWVVCFLARLELDMSGGSNARINALAERVINALAERVTKDGLLVYGDSWSDTTIGDSDVL
jgi:hypothetical protein